MKKQLNESAIMNELKGGSLFFQRSAEEAVDGVTEEEPAPQPAPRKTRKKATTTTEESEPAKPLSSPSTEDTATPVQQNPIPDSGGKGVAPQFSDELVETVRKSVKQLGKEATFCRFTQEEKSALSEIIYYYKRNGIRTSENEIIRTAVNYLLANYQTNGNDSLLAKVLAKLNA